MPIQVQPSVVSNPASAVQPSVPAIDAATAQAFQEQQAGAAAGERGMGAALQSAESAAQQSGARARTAMAIGAQSMQQGLASLGEAASKYREEKVNAALEQRIVQRQIDKEALEQYPGAIAQLDAARNAAMDKDGNVPAALDAKIAASKAQLKESFAKSNRTVRAQALGDLNGVLAMAVKQQEVNKRAQGDVVDMLGLEASKAAVKAAREQGVRDNVVKLALKSTANPDTLSAYQRWVDDGIAALPPGASDEQIAASAAPVLARPIIGTLNDGGRRLMAAISSGDGEAVKAAAGAIDPQQAKIIHAYLDDMSNVPTGGQSAFQELLKTAPPGATSKIMADMDKGRSYFEMEMSTNPNLVSQDMQFVSLDRYRAAVKISEDSRPSKDAPPKVRVGDVLEHMDSAKPGRVEAPPATSFTGSAPPPPEARAAQSAGGAPSAASPAPPPGQPGAMGPPTPSAQDQYMAALLDPRATHAEVKAANDGLARHAAGQLAFVQALGGDKAAAEALTKAAKMMGGEGGAKAAAERYGLAETGKFGGWEQALKMAGDYPLTAPLRNLDAKSRAAFGASVKNISDEDLAAATMAAAAVRAKTATPAEAEQWIADKVRAAEKPNRAKAEKYPAGGDREAALERAKDASRNVLVAYRKLVSDDDLAGKVIPEAVTQMVVGRPEYAAGMAPDAVEAYRRLQAARAERGGR